MSRNELLAQIAALSEEAYEQVSPYLEADLAAVGEDHQALLEEVGRGLRSAAEEPLHEDSAVQAELAGLLPRR